MVSRTSKHQDQDQSKTGIDTHRRLTLGGIAFEAVDGTDNSVISLSIEGKEPIVLEDNDIDNIVRLLASQQRRRSRQSATPNQNPSDGRGRVTNEETDKRITREQS